jgi:hypothetical protein
MREILAALVLLVAPLSSHAHELTSALGDAVRVSSNGGSTAVEYCPDNTCEVFELSGASASLPIQDFALVYLFGISEYVYLEPFQSNDSSPAIRAVLARYQSDCPHQSARVSARCVASLLAKRHAIRASFVRYDEGERNVVPIPLAGHRHGT